MSTMTLIQTGIPPTAPGDVSVTSDSPPIVHVFRVTVSILSAALSTISVLSASVWLVLKTLLVPFGYLLSGLSTPLLYILSPVIVLARILVQVLITGPYSLVVGLLRAIYPIYVFVGAACIVAAGIGFCARGASHLLHASIFEAGAASEDIAPPTTTAEGVQSKIPKKVSIKAEADGERAAL